MAMKRRRSNRSNAQEYQSEFPMVEQGTTRAFRGLVTEQMVPSITWKMGASHFGCFSYFISMKWYRDKWKYLGFVMALIFIKLLASLVYQILPVPSNLIAKHNSDIIHKILLDITDYVLFASVFFYVIIIIYAKAKLKDLDFFKMHSLRHEEKTFKHVSWALLMVMIVKTIVLILIIALWFIVTPFTLDDILHWPALLAMLITFAVLVLCSIYAAYMNMRLIRSNVSIRKRIFYISTLSNDKLTIEQKENIKIGLLYSYTIKSIVESNNLATEQYYQSNRRLDIMSNFLISALKKKKQNEDVLNVAGNHSEIILKLKEAAYMDSWDIDVFIKKYAEKTGLVSDVDAQKIILLTGTNQVKEIKKFLMEKHSMSEKRSSNVAVNEAWRQLQELLEKIRGIEYSLNPYIISVLRQIDDKYKRVPGAVAKFIEMLENR